MSLPTQSGKYKGSPIAWAVKPTGNNNLPTFIVTWTLALIEINGEWQQITSGDTIDAYYYLRNKNGEANKFTLEMLRDVFGWDTASYSSLAGNSWGDVEAQLVIEMETYEGRTRPKVKYTNPADWEGGAHETDAGLVADMDAKYGSELRAMFSGNSGTPPKPTSTPARDAMTAAWNKFTKTTDNAGKPKEEIGNRWKNAVAAYFGATVDAKSLVAEQWNRFAADNFIDSGPL